MRGVARSMPDSLPVYHSGASAPRFNTLRGVMRRRDGCVQADQPDLGQGVRFFAECIAVSPCRVPKTSGRIDPCPRAIPRVPFPAVTPCRALGSSGIAGVLPGPSHEKTASRRFRRNCLNLLVGETGFEPATSTSRT